MLEDQCLVKDDGIHYDDHFVNWTPSGLYRKHLLRTAIHRTEGR